MRGLSAAQTLCHPAHTANHFQLLFVMLLIKSSSILSRKFAIQFIRCVIRPVLDRPNVPIDGPNDGRLRCIQLKFHFLHLLCSICARSIGFRCIRAGYDGFGGIFCCATFLCRDSSGPARLRSGASECIHTPATITLTTKRNGSPIGRHTGEVLA